VTVPKPYRVTPSEVSVGTFRPAKTVSRPVPATAPPSAGEQSELDEATRKRLKALKARFGDRLVTIKYYPLEDVLAKMHSELGLDQKQAQTQLTRHLASLCDEPEQPDSLPVWAWWNGTTLGVVQTLAGHHGIKTALQDIRKQRIQQILINCRLFEVPSEQAQKLYRAGFLNSITTSTARTSDLPENDRSVARFSFTVLDNLQAETLLNRIRKLKSVKVLAEPTLVTINARPACLHVGGSKQFIAGFKDDGTPEVVVRRFGTELHVLPIVLQNGFVRVELHLRVTTMGNMETKQIENPVSGELVTHEFPSFNAREVETGIEMRPGQTAIIGGMEQKAGSNQTKRLFLAVRPTLPNIEKETPLIR
ncbi:MAG: hypothetical protein JW888_14280, partial [Pirellulales bacterium]|nr:hypothetical protein [Pirellulales bacterium]